METIGKKVAIKSFLVICSMFMLSASVANAAPLWFQTKMSQCVLNVHKWIKEKDPEQSIFKENLYLDYAQGGSVNLGVKGAEVGFSFPGIGMDKRRMPGAGFCCVYDDDGNEKFAQMVLKGNDECWDTMRLMKNNENAANPAARKTNWHAGLYWCKGPEANCFMDWWYEYHKE